MINPKRLLDDLKRLLHRLEADLRERAGTVAELHELQQREYRAARETGRTGESFKRRWNTEPWEEQEKRALRHWLLDRLEDERYWPEPQLQTTRFWPASPNSSHGSNSGTTTSTPTTMSAWETSSRFFCTASSSSAA